jgi:predicted metal-binding membrane protein
MSGLLAPPAERRPLGLIAGLSVVTLGSWVYLVAVHAAMGTTGSGLAMPMTSAWSRADVVLMWTMWAVMMAAMMLPAATPMLSAYARTVRSPRSSVHGSIPGFLGGYLAVWSGFALLATGLQWVLHNATLITAMGSSTSRWLAGPTLLLAGAYQFTALKHTMLLRCRSPLGFLLNHWRNGRRGACLMGAHHGLLCVGCCWALMGLLFVVGVMNLWWIMLLSTVVLIEKVTRSDAVPRVLGAVMLLWGLLTLAGAWA